MAKLKLTVYGVEGTVTDQGTSPQEAVNLSMSTGESTVLEAKCYFEVAFTGKRVIDKGIDSITEEPIEGTGPVQFAMNAQNIRFMKRMYSPNEITADIQIAPITQTDGNTTTSYIATVSKEALEKVFINKKVSLTSDNDKVVCNDYYVYEMIPRYKKDATYVTLKIYSPDHLLTLEEYCRTFVTKKLGSEILDTELKNYTIPYAVNDDEKLIKADITNMKHLKKNTQEHIFPYLVQYNESFYDFLKRTTNRWGEFLYYESGQLHIGYPEEAGTNAYKALADTTTYCDLTTKQPKQGNAGTYHSENKDEELNSLLKKGGYDKVIGQMDSLAAWDDKSGDIYLMKKLAAILGNEKSVYSFVIDTLADDALAMAQAYKVSGDKNEAFDNAYFNKKDKKDVTFSTEQFGKGDSEFSEFSEHEQSSVFSSNTYASIVKKEIASGKNAVTIDFDTNYPDLKLGQTILVDGKKYLIIQVEGYQPEMLKIVKNVYVNLVVDTGKVVFKVTAIPQNRINETEDNGFYPSILPEGHIKRSGMQLAKVVDVDDPLRKNRVRIRFDWQNDSEAPSPWLIYASAAASPKSGVHGKHYKNEPVMVDFINGNIERPYVVGSIEQEMPSALKTNNIVYTTPGGQAIKMSDGTGAGLNAMLASINPGAKLIQGFFPTLTWGEGLGDGKVNKYLEGNIELTDKYGFWSIKGSTNDRNISIKSPWGDVKINAFTGITISAPNGDVKIAGKNVTIEAGANLELKSGKNIKQKFFMESEDKSWGGVALAVSKAVGKKLISTVFNVTDLSLLRHVFEIFVRPIEGKIELAAGRYLMLESGGGKAEYPVQAYKKAKEVSEKGLAVTLDFGRVGSVVTAMYDAHKNLYNVARQKKAALAVLVNDCKMGNELQCKTIDEIITALWNDPRNVDAAIDFNGIYRDVSPNDNVDFGIMAHFHPSFGVTEFFRMFVNPGLLKQRWREAITYQQAKKVSIKQAATQLGIAMYKLTDFRVAPTVERIVQDVSPQLLRTLTDDNLPADCLFKTISTKEGFKTFSSDYTDEALAGEKKKVCRKYFIDLVNAYGFKRQASAGIGGILKASVPAEPAPDCADADWTAYVNSIQAMPPKPEETLGKKIVKGAITDPLKQTILGDLDKWKSFFHDDWAWGSSKKGQILFTSNDGTMVLDRNIYRANVNNEEDSEIGDIQRLGLVSRIRAAMLQN